MSLNHCNQKFTQFTEESLPPVQVPLQIGSEFYLVTQQDVRRIEDTRYLSFNRLDQNGILKPVLDSLVVELLLPLLRNVGFNNNVQNNGGPIFNGNPQYCPPETMDVATDAAIDHQLKWDKCTSAPMTLVSMEYHEVKVCIVGNLSTHKAVKCKLSNQKEFWDG